MDLEILTKKKFYDAMRKCKYNSAILSSEEYFNLVTEVKNIQPGNHRLTKRYGIMLLNGVETLICPVSNKQSHFKIYVMIDDLYDILHNFHQSIGHGQGKREMIELVKTWFKNISKSEIKLYLSLCIECKKKKKLKKTSIVKPFSFEDFNSRGIIDIIDFNSQPDGDYNYICVYQHNLTNFYILRPLTSNSAKHIADVLLDIFCLFGAPVILQTHRHSGFRKDIMYILRETWPDLNVIHERSCHTESQSNVENAKQDVENILTAWMQDNETIKWSEGLRFVQFLKNKVHHNGTKKSPFNEMFGTYPQIDLSSDILSDQVLRKMILEKNVGETNESIAEPSRVNRKRKQSEDCQDANDNYENQENDNISLSNAKFTGAEGSSVRIKITNEDRKRGEPRFINAVILRTTEDGRYQLGCKSGTLKELYVRSQFVKCSKHLLSLSDVPMDKQISLQTAMEQSVVNGQRCIVCSCKKKCINNRCKCRKNGLACNTNCHRDQLCCTLKF